LHGEARKFGERYARLGAYGLTLEPKPCETARRDHDQAADARIADECIAAKPKPQKR
jgi:hypothetical protein